MSDRDSQPSKDLVQVSTLEKIEEKIESEFYELRKGEVWFSEEVKREHRRLKTPLFRYILSLRIMAILTCPFIYGCIIPFALLDLFVSTYQAVCFPAYGVPKARRHDYIAIDRKKLQYLNALEGINCLYCSYANGLLAYVVEVAARTEQHWCPIRHARRIQNAHDRYAHFLPYGDARAYRENIEKVRCDFNDVKK